MSLYFLNSNAIVLCFHKALDPLVKLICTFHLYTSHVFFLPLLAPSPSLQYCWQSTLKIIVTRSITDGPYGMMIIPLWHNHHSSIPLVQQDLCTYFIICCSLCNDLDIFSNVKIICVYSRPDFRHFYHDPQPTLINAFNPVNQYTTLWVCVCVKKQYLHEYQHEHVATV